MENNCAEEPNKLCEFKRLSGRILKTVDSVYQDVSSVDECRELCLNSPYRYAIVIDFDFLICVTEERSYIHHYTRNEATWCAFKLISVEVLALADGK